MSHWDQYYELKECAAYGCTRLTAGIYCETCAMTAEEEERAC